ncbi:MAG: acetyl-CoA carboxylase biotin carboxyl carrier protein [Rhizobiaceae bacterium]
MTIKAQDIAALVELFEASNWDELHVEVEGLHLFLSTDPDARLAGGSAPQALATSIPAAAPARVSAAPAAAVGAAAPADAGSAPSDWVAVTAPNLGTFYRAPKPGAAPFVEIGQTVSAETEICLLEVMKLFTAVRAGVKGTIRRICVADAEMVEFGQALFYVEPA